MTSIHTTDPLTGASTWTGAVPLAARVLTAAIFLFSGVGKVTAPAATIGYIASVGLPLPEVAYGLAVLAELGLGAALLVGFRTRWAALGLAVFSLTAAVLFHRDMADQNQLVHFLKNLAMAGGLLQIAAYGAGRFSFDARG